MLQVNLDHSETRAWNAVRLSMCLLLRYFGSFKTGVRLGLTKALLRAKRIIWRSPKGRV